MEHSFDIERAKKYGGGAAILYRNFQFWIAKNKANGKNFQEGRTWTYNALSAYADLFPYASVWAIRQALEKLVNAQELVKGNYNTNGYDRTTWYAFKDEKAALKGLPAHLWNSQMEGAKTTNRSVRNRKPIPNPKPYELPDKNKEIEMSAEQRLELDLKIACKSKFFMEQISLIFKPYGTEITTFANMVKYLVSQCQAGKLNVSIFKDAVGWAKQAKASNATNKKGLFVKKIKQETGFKAQSQLLKR